jgi:hypothetical protein
MIDATAMRRSSTMRPCHSAPTSPSTSRSGPDLLGDLIDAYITAKPIDDAFSKHNLGTLQQVDDDWRSWLAERADLLNPR